jgi:hypothetical protein
MYQREIKEVLAKDRGESMSYVPHIRDYTMPEEPTIHVSTLT